MRSLPGYFKRLVASVALLTIVLTLIAVHSSRTTAGTTTNIARYLPQYASAPNCSRRGQMYYNTATNKSQICSVVGSPGTWTDFVTGSGALLPSQTSHSGEYLTTNGTTASWATVSAGISNSAGANVVPKSNGTNLVASDISENGTFIHWTLPAYTGSLGIGYGNFRQFRVEGANNGGYAITTSDGLDFATSVMFGGSGTAGLGEINNGTQGTLRDLQMRTGYFSTSVVSPQYVNGTTTARPTCDSSSRGTLYHFYGGAGVKDTVDVCAKDAADAYAWRAIY